MRLPRNRNILASLGLLALIACSINVSFDINKDFVADATGTSLETIVTVNLSDYQAVKDNKDKLEGLSIGAADLTITEVRSTNKATSVSGTAELRAVGSSPGGTGNVVLGTITNFEIRQGATLKIPGNKDVDAFLLRQIKSTGTFEAVIKGTTTGGEAHVTINAKLHMDLLANTGGVF